MLELDCRGQFQRSQTRTEVYSEEMVKAPAVAAAGFRTSLGRNRFDSFEAMTLVPAADLVELTCLAFLGAAVAALERFWGNLLLEMLHMYRLIIKVIKFT